MNRDNWHRAHSFYEAYHRRLERGNHAINRRLVKVAVRGLQRSSKANSSLSRPKTRMALKGNFKCHVYFFYRSCPAFQFGRRTLQ